MRCGLRPPRVSQSPGWRARWALFRCEKPRSPCQATTRSSRRVDRSLHRLGHVGAHGQPVASEGLIGHRAGLGGGAHVGGRCAAASGSGASCPGGARFASRHNARPSTSRAGRRSRRPCARRWRGGARQRWLHRSMRRMVSGSGPRPLCGAVRWLGAGRSGRPPMPTRRPAGRPVRRTRLGRSRRRARSWAASASSMFLGQLGEALPRPAMARRSSASPPAADHALAGHPFELGRRAPRRPVGPAAPPGRRGLCCGELSLRAAVGDAPDLAGATQLVARLGTGDGRAWACGSGPVVCPVGSDEVLKAERGVGRRRPRREQLTVARAPSRCCSVTSARVRSASAASTPPSPRLTVERPSAWRTASSWRPSAEQPSATNRPIEP